MEFQKFIFDGTSHFSLESIEPSCTDGIKNKAQSLEILRSNKQKINNLQKALYAERKQGLLLMFQAMDTAGKDGTIKHVFSGIDPAGISITSFKTPTSTELAHDYLWRIHRAVPEYGYIGVFNRSHYEDVLIAKVMDLPAQQNRSNRILDNIWRKRYRQINDFESYLYENGYTLLKFFLHISKEEQRKRFLKRLDDPDKNWKFAISDLDTRAKWDEYMTAYEMCINKTSTVYAPWAVIPADHKWYMRALVSEIISDTMNHMRPKFPMLSEKEQNEIKKSSKILV